MIEEKNNKVKNMDLSAISKKEDTIKRNDLSAISNTGIVKRNDFIEIKYTGYADGKAFDSNIEEDLKKINPEAKEEKTIIVVGQGMVVSGLNRALEEKEIGKKYEISVKAKDLAFSFN